MKIHHFLLNFSPHMHVADLHWCLLVNGQTRRQFCSWTKSLLYLKQLQLLHLSFIRHNYMYKHSKTTEFLGIFFLAVTLWSFFSIPPLGMPIIILGIPIPSTNLRANSMCYTLCFHPFKSSLTSIRDVNGMLEFLSYSISIQKEFKCN